MVYVTRKEHFNAAHKLYNPAWSAERNKEVFGKCANDNWHGHNFELFVTVKGLPHPDTGFVIDLKLLRDLIRERVTEKLDHMNINLDVDFMRGILASTENLAIGIWKQLESSIAAEGAQLHCIKLFETERNFVEYYGGL
jgi:6-pyruvoyltetrahydropterin/6-carboxytetrahydropterin synthase